MMILRKRVRSGEAGVAAEGVGRGRVDIRTENPVRIIVTRLVAAGAAAAGDKSAVGDTIVGGRGNNNLKATVTRLRRVRGERRGATAQGEAEEEGGISPRDDRDRVEAAEEEEEEEEAAEEEEAGD
jgi:hypothetical protein